MCASCSRRSRSGPARSRAPSAADPSPPGRTVWWPRPQVIEEAEEMGGWRTPVALLLAVGALLATAGTQTAAQAAGTTALVAHGSVQQAYATGLAPRAAATLLRHGARVTTRRADGQGGVLFRGVAPGGGYRIRSGARRSGPLTVMTGRDAPPSTKLYEQSIPAEPGQGELTAPDQTNYQYLATRDGTKLAIDVHTPAGAGPWPTLIEYS